MNLKPIPEMELPEPPQGTWSNIIYHLTKEFPEYQFGHREGLTAVPQRWWERLLRRPRRAIPHAHVAVIGYVYSLDVLVAIQVIIDRHRPVGVPVQAEFYERNRAAEEHLAARGLIR